jgi:low affinity Fe/Cu permease
MLQVFHTDVTKVDLDVAYVAIAIYICCKRLFKMFQLFQTYVTSVFSLCCICFTHILQVYVLNVSAISDV